MTNNEVLERFHREYQLLHRISEQRQKTQLRALREFSAFTGAPLLECRNGELSAWMGSLVESGMHVNTVRKKGNMVRPFYAWAYQADLIDGSHLMAIRSVSNPRGSSGRTLPKPYSNKDLKRWREQLDEAFPYRDEIKLGYWRTGRANYRKVAIHAQRLQLDAIVALALNCGLRRSEIRALSIDDMHPDNAYVVVENGKGDKPREVPHTEASREAVGTWLDFRDEMKPNTDDPWLSLAPNQPSGGWLEPMSERRYSSLLHRIGKQREWRLHRFRHTCATNWLRAGLPLELLQKLLGHSSIEQTLMYAELVKEDVQRQVEKLEPEFARLLSGD